MSKYPAIAVLFLATSGCAAWPDKPRLCFSNPVSASPLTSGELKARAEVRKRVVRGCGYPGVECNVQLRNATNGDIEVTVSRAAVSGNPPTCIHLEGGFETYVFSSEGKYLRTVLGL